MSVSIVIHACSFLISLFRDSHFSSFSSSNTLELIKLIFSEKNADLLPQLGFAQLPFFCQFVPAREEKKAF